MGGIISRGCSSGYFSVSGALFSGGIIKFSGFWAISAGCPTSFSLISVFSGSGLTEVAKDLVSGPVLKLWSDQATSLILKDKPPSTGWEEGIRPERNWRERVVKIRATLIIFATFLPFLRLTLKS